ncbi:MAG: NADH-quinone oxidoreductase subunit C [Nitrospirae bacterium]|nr:NADH-quinone oxidoreductase subunit C [Nitrospirota bacterium]
MEPVEIANKIKEEFPTEVVEVKEFRGQVGITIKKNELPGIIRRLNASPEFDFDYLKDLCGVDYMNVKVPRFEVVYQLYSIRHGHMLRLNVQVSENSPTIASVTAVYSGANWHERECYDMFGIVFDNHPDLRRILLPEDWEGYPLRKDYPTAGTEEEWRGFKEVLLKAEEYKKYEWKK